MAVGRSEYAPFFIVQARPSLVRTALQPRHAEVPARQADRGDRPPGRRTRGGRLVPRWYPTKGETRRAVADAFEVSALLQAIRKAPLTEADAVQIVRVLKDQELIETAVVKPGAGSETLVAFLRRFWDFESSPYIREKLAHGHAIGRRHCYDMAGCIRTCWEPFFKDRNLSELRKSDLRDFSLWLAETRKLKAKSINTALAAGTVALRWAHAEELIQSNPGANLVKFSGAAVKRGVLTVQEVKQVFETSWLDERARLGNVLAMCTGLRAGEILALQVRDIIALADTKQCSRSIWHIANRNTRDTVEFSLVENFDYPIHLSISVSLLPKSA